MAGVLLPRLRVFLTSPGDVGEERAIVRTFLQQLPTDPFVRDRATIELVAWDSPGGGAPMLAARTPQASIDAGLPRPSECDIVIAVFWGRIGTPLPHPEYARSDGTAYESGSVWELEEALDTSRRIGRPDVLIYRRLPPHQVDLTTPDADDRIAQFRGLEAYFGRFTDAATGVIHTAYSIYEKPDDFRQRVELDLRSLVKDALDGSDHAPLAQTEAPPAPLWQGSPFPGLRSFTPADAPIFFGRGRETDLLVSRVTTSPFVTVIGASGSGKSSIVGAGLIPRLAESEPALLLPSFDRDTRRWSGLRFTPGELGPDPFLPFAAQLAPLVADVPREIASRLRTEPITVLDELGRASGTTGALVFCDQFEELFTVVAEEHRDPFIELLAALASAGAHRVVVTLRSDFYQRCVERPALARLMEDGQIPVAAPTDQLLEMITRPATIAGLTFEEELVGRLLYDTGTGAGALPLLAFALDELYRLSDGQMTLAAYEALGGVQGAIGVRAEHVYQKRIGDAERDVFPQVFRELVEIDDDGRPARRRAPMSAIQGIPAAIGLVGAFTDARLLVSGAGAHGASFEVAHEALFRSWRRLRDVIERQRDDLRLLQVVIRAARDWDASGRAPSYLWPHERLEPVYEMRDRLHPVLDPVTEAFIRPESERLLVSLAATDTAPYQRSATADRLATIGPSTVAGLVPLLRSGDERVRAAAAHALGRIGTAVVVPVAEVAAGATEPESRLSAVAVLRAVADEASVAALAVAARDSDERVRSAAVGALGGIHRPDARDALVGALSDRSIDVRWQAAGALAAFGDTAIPALVEALGGRSPEAAEAAANALLALGSIAMPSLIASMGSSSSTAAREAAAHVLVRLGGEAASELAATSPSPSPDEEWRVVSVLGAIGDRVATDRVVAALRSPDEVVKAAAVDALNELGDPRALPALLPMLDDPDDDVRDLAAAALAQLGPSAVEPLVDLLSTTRSDVVRRGCRVALLAIGAPAVPRLVQELGTTDQPASAELVLTALGAVAAPAWSRRSRQEGRQRMPHSGSSSRSVHLRSAPSWPPSNGATRRDMRGRSTRWRPSARPRPRISSPPLWRTRIRSCGRLACAVSAVSDHQPCRCSCRDSPPPNQRSVRPSSPPRPRSAHRPCRS